MKWLSLACILLASPLGALTQEDVLSAKLVSGDKTQTGQMAGLILSLTPGWKTYWRAPGEAGIPPIFDWSGSTNVQSVEVFWPRPTVFLTNGMQTIGYNDQVLFPLQVKAIDPNLPIKLVGQVDLGICKEICMPVNIQVEHDLGTPSNSAQIKAAMRDQPARKGRALCKIRPSENGLNITAHIHLPKLPGDENVVIEPPNAGYWAAGTSATREGDVLIAQTEFHTIDKNNPALERSGIVITVLGADSAVEIRGCPAE